MPTHKTQVNPNNNQEKHLTEKCIIYHSTKHEQKINVSDLTFFLKTQKREQKPIT